MPPNLMGMGVHVAPKARSTSPCFRKKSSLDLRWVPSTCSKGVHHHLGSGDSGVAVKAPPTSLLHKKIKYDGMDVRHRVPSGPSAAPLSPQVL